MTAILGYIGDESEAFEISMFLASDGLVIWHDKNGDKPQTDYKKIYRFKNFLISFNGEVAFYEDFLQCANQITKEISNIQDFQNEINQIFPFDKYGDNLGRFSKARYSNIILLDINNKTLAHHFAGCVSRSCCFFYPFNFQILDRKHLYHFGSKVSFMNEISKDKDAFFIEKQDLIKQTASDQIEAWKTCFEMTNQMFNGVGELNSYFFLDQNNYEHQSNLGIIK